MEKEEIIKEFIEKYRPYFVKFLTPKEETELYGSIRSSIDQARQDTIKECLGVLPKEEEYQEDDNKYPDVRWQKENYGKKKYTQAIRQVKHNLETLKQQIKKEI